MDTINKSEKKLIATIIVLAFVAVGLGIAIYKQGLLGSLMPSKTSSLKSTTSKTQQQSTDPRSKRPLPTGLSQDELALMSPPHQGDTDEVKMKHYKIGQKLAKEADVLELNKCNGPSPLDLKLVSGQDFKVKNSDSQNHTIIIDKDHQYMINANSTKTVKADFGRGNGLYGYLCDNLSGVAGFFFVTPKQ